MRGLTIDIGNTALKFAEFDNGQITSFKRIKHYNIIEQIREELNNAFDYIALCTVKPSLANSIKQEFPNIQVIDSSNYESMIDMYLGNPPKHAPFPELGVDIAVGCFGALNYGFENIIVIDSGTATTITAVINKRIEAVYIHPGFKLSKSSLIGGTEALDDDSLAIKIRSGRAADTQACIDLAIYHGLNGAVKQIIDVIKSEYKLEFKVFITGGDTSDFYIDADYRDDKLVNIGLDAYIRKMNIK